MDRVTGSLYAALWVLAGTRTWGLLEEQPVPLTDKYPAPSVSFETGQAVQHMLPWDLLCVAAVQLAWDLLCAITQAGFRFAVLPQLPECWESCVPGEGRFCSWGTEGFWAVIKSSTGRAGGRCNSGGLLVGKTLSEVVADWRATGVRRL